MSERCAKNSLLLVLLVFNVYTYAQSKNKIVFDRLVGKWQPTHFKKRNEPKKSIEFPSVGYMLFLSDSTHVGYRLVVGRKGYWKVISNGRKIHLRHTKTFSFYHPLTKSQKEDVFTIIKLTKDELVISEPTRFGTMIVWAKRMPDEEYYSEIEYGYYRLWRSIKDSILVEEGFKHYGKKKGVWTYYYKDGTPEKQVDHWKEYRSRVLRTWHSNGKLKFEFDKEGNMLHYHDNGQLRSKTNADGSEVIVEYHPNGTLAYDFKEVRNDRLDELVEQKNFYRQDAGVERIGQWADGTKHGKFVWYQPNGSRSKEEFYRNGKLVEAWKWNEHGGSTYHFRIIEGIEVEQKIKYFNQEDTSWVATFRNGEIHGRTVTWYEPGEMRRQQFYNSGKLTGTAYRYHSTPPNQVHAKLHYKNGKLDGVQQFFNHKGKLKLEIRYTSGTIEPKYKKKNPKYPERR